jgi:hypothetical protein
MSFAWLKHSPKLTYPLLALISPAVVVLLAEGVEAVSLILLKLAVTLLDNEPTVVVVVVVAPPPMALIPLAKSVANLAMWLLHVITLLITHTPVIPTCKLFLQPLNLPLMTTGMLILVLHITSQLILTI